MSLISISSNFDAGAIEVVNADDPADIRLRIRPDTHADFAQWFYFRVSDARGRTPRNDLRERRAMRFSRGLARL